MPDDLNALLAANRSSSVLQGIANPPQVNPLAAINAGNQAAQQEFETRAWQAKQAAGNAFLRSIDPNTGQPNQAQLLRNLASDPTSALAAQNSAQAGQTLDTGTYDLHNKRLTSMMSGMGQLIADNPNGVPAEAASAVVDHRLALGLITPEEAQAMKGRLTSDPVKNTQIILQGMTGNLSAQSALEAAKPRIGTQDLGGRVVGTQTTPLASSTAQPGAISTVGPGIDYGLTPAQRGAPVEWIGTDGTPHKGTLEEMHREMGIATPSGSAVSGGAGAGGAGGGSAGGGGGGGGGAAPRKAASVTGPEPGMEAKWKASADAYNADNADAGTYQQRVFPLVQAHTILKSGDVTTGAGAEALNSVKSRLMTVATSLGVDAQTIAQADFDKTAKYMQQYVNQQGLSGRSDQAMASAISGNPSAHISTLANQQILPVMIGMERMKQMMITDFTRAGGKPNQYSDYKTNWQNTHDPRAFLFDMMDQPQREKMVAGMTKDQKIAFARSLDMVERNPEIMGQAAMPGH